MVAEILDVLRRVGLSSFALFRVTSSPTPAAGDAIWFKATAPSARTANPKATDVVRRPLKSVVMADVARRAGVSQQTVPRVINDSPNLPLAEWPGRSHDSRPGRRLFRAGVTAAIWQVSIGSGFWRI